MHQPDRIIRLSTVFVRTGLSRSTIYLKIAEGTFPAQIKISIHGAGGGNPTSTDGSKIPYHEGRGEKAMKSDKAGGIGCRFNRILVTMTPLYGTHLMPQLTTLREVAGR